MKPMPPERAHLQALFSAYVEASGRQLTLSHPRMQTLREFDRRGFLPGDVKAVIGELSRRVRKGVHGYTEASLDWANAMGNPDRFEERLAVIRQRKQTPKAEVSTIAEPPPEIPPVDQEAMAAQAKRLSAELRAKLYGK